MKILFLINSYGLRSETFISDQIAYYSRKAKVKIWCKFGEVPSENYHSFQFPDLKKRWTFIFQNINKLKSADFFHIIKRIPNLKYYLNAEVLYYIVYIRKFCLENEFDVVYSHFGMNGKLAEELKYFNVLKVKDVVVNFHGLDLLSSTYSKRYYAHLFNEVKMVICGSKYAFKQLVDLGNYNKNTLIIPCGVNDKLFDSNPIVQKKNPDKIKIISVGRFVEFKGMIRFIDLAKRLLSLGFKDFNIQLVGMGPEFKKIKERIIANNLNNYIILTGSLSHAEVSKKIIESDVFVYLGIVDSKGRAETQGVVILEAQYSYLPVIATKVGGVHEYVKEGYTGFVFEETDISAISEKIILLQNNRNELSDMGRAAHQYVKNNFTQEILLKKNYECITNL